MKTLSKFLFCMVLLSGAVPAGFARGDKLIPQVVDGPGWNTYFDLTNVSPEVPINGTMRLSFFKSDGSPWSLETNLGTKSSFDLNLAPRQTLRVETRGGPQLTAGYAVIFDQEPLNSEYSEDYVLGISVFYVYSENSVPVDTVTVSVPQPTAVAMAPVEVSASADINSGIVIANWAGEENAVTLRLYHENGTQFGGDREVTFTLQPGQQRSAYLNEQVLFGELANQNFKGMMEVIATGPVALLGLRQTTAVTGFQFATLVPVDKESLRRNTNMVLLQASDDDNPFMPLDIDNFTVDYFRTTDGTEKYPWDLEYRYVPPNSEARYLEAKNNAGIVSIGFRDNGEFDSISLPQLKALNYQKNGRIDLPDTILNRIGFTFAVKTDIGNYAKVRIVRVVDTNDDPFFNKDLVLEVTVYK